MLYFGAGWGAPALEGGDQIPTPVGEPCLACQESIVDGDQGYVVVSFAFDDDKCLDSRRSYTHAECQFFQVAGHTVGICACTGYAPTRENAKLAWKQPVPEGP